MTPLLHLLLGGPSPAPVAFDALTAFRAAWSDALSGARGPEDWSPFDAAVIGGFTADRLGYAFAGGYASALRALVPSLDPGIPACLCVTEEGGAHPRAIRTALAADGTLTGRKQWSTLASEGEVLLVACVTAESTPDRPRLAVALVRADAHGVTLSPMPATPFTPEIPHFSVTFAATPVLGLLPGDGWDAFIKPFRTVEDIHVCGAALGHLVRIGRQAGWPREEVAGLIAVVVALRALSLAAPDDAAVHVGLGGVLGAMDEAVRACEPHWATAEPVVAARWMRDAPILHVAGRARAARFERAWERLSSAGLGGAGHAP